MKLRSVELRLPQAAQAAEFLEHQWGLIPAGSSGATRFLRGTGGHPYILSVSQAEAAGVAAVTFSGTPDEIDSAKEKSRKSGARVTEVYAFDVPGGGRGFTVEGPEGQVYQLVAEAAPCAPLPERGKPVQLTHAVINTLSREQCERFAVEALGFKVSDRTGHMTFVRCNRKHHCIAYAKSEVPSLNHIAFEMEDIDAVMRGLGRMRDAGFEPVWGPGRHGPGNNVFGYFIAPFGAVIEYTAEVEEVGEDYRIGGPEDWKWPAGRMDHWGLSKKDMAKIGPAEKAFRFK